MKIEDVLNGIYGNDDSGVFVYDLSGNVVWINKTADCLVSEEKLSVKELFSAIKISQKKSGGLFVGSGGFFRKAEICGEELYIAEVYSQSRLAGVFGTPFFEKFAGYSDTQTRQAVTGISAACEIIGDSFENDSRSCVPDCLESIISSCRRLMRTSSVSVQLATAVSEKNMHKQCIYLPEFTEKLSAGFAAAMGNESCIGCTDATECFVNADRELLTYFILMLARKIMPHKSMRLGISASSDGEYAEISVFSEENGDASDYEIISNSDGIFSAAFDIIAEKLDADYYITANRATVRLKCAQYDGEVVMESDKRVLDDGLFSPCRIMLSDLTDFRRFY